MRSRIPDSEREGDRVEVPGPGLRLHEACQGRHGPRRFGERPQVDPAPAQFDGPAAPQLGQLDLAAGVDRHGEQPGTLRRQRSGERRRQPRVRPGCAGGSGAPHRGRRAPRTRRAAGPASGPGAATGRWPPGARPGPRDPDAPGRPARRPRRWSSSLMGIRRRSA